MFTWIRETFQTIRTAVCRFFQTVGRAARRLGSRLWEAAPSVGVVIVCSAVNIAALIWGRGLLTTGVVAGVGIVLSIACVLAGIPQCFWRVCAIASRFGFLMDLGVTMLLTIGGFTFGPTMGIVGLFLGINFSVLIAFLRILHVLHADSHSTFVIAS